MGMTGTRNPLHAALAAALTLALAGTAPARAADEAAAGASAAMAPATAASDAAGAAAAPLPTLADLLAAARAAAGGAAWDGIATLQAEGRIRTSGMEGRWQESADLRRGRFRTAVDVGVYRVSEGFDGRVRWRQDPSGGVHALDAAFTRTNRITDAWLARRAWLQADAATDGTGWSALAARTEDGRRFEVVTATPRGGRPVELWFDARTRLLARSVRRMPISTQTTLWDDWRPAAGVRLPFRIESRDSGGSPPDVVTVERWSTPRAGDAAFAQARPPADTTLAAPTTVPIEVTGFVTVGARLDGKPYEFILDTGGHNIVTPGVAQALGLKPIGAGASGGAGEGTIAQQDVRIPTLQIGAATLRDQHFYVIPLQYDTVERGARPPLAGILGLEVFERLAARIDYAARTMTLRTFAQAGRERRRGEPVAIAFDDDIPLFDGRIAGRPGVIALDTGNGGSMVVQAAWAKENGLAETMKRGLELVSFGAGGESRNWASRVATLQIGSTVIERPIARYAEDRAGSFSSITEAANIGTEILAHFALDIDYARGTIWFDRDPAYVAPPLARSGARVSKDDPGAFTVALVTPGSPAAEAGLAKGDRIVSVDGVDAARLSGFDLWQKHVQPPGTTVVYGVARGNDVQRVSVVLREMLP
jgi:predicted aspartyl protease